MPDIRPERWHRISDLFEGALGLPVERRAEYLAAQCGDEAELRRYVESLLRHFSEGPEFLEHGLTQGPPHAPQAPGVPGSGGVPTAQAAPGGPLRRGAPTDDRAASLEGRAVGPYLIRTELGRGGMGVVYLAEDTRLGRPVAIKVLPRALAEDPDRRERLRREARSAAALVHQNIASVYSLEEWEGELFYVSEFVRGRTLRTLLHGEPLRPEQLLEVALATTRALTAAHAHGIVHRDLKPENVMLASDGPIKVIDFGLARQFSPLVTDEEGTHTKRTEAGMMIGTPGYMAPEQIEGGRVDYRTDLFALGVMLYEAGTGHHPFPGRSLISTIAQIMEKDPVPFAAAAPTVLGDLAPIVDRCLKKDPAQRYLSTEELLEDLVKAKIALGRRLSGTHGPPTAAALPSPEPVDGRLAWWMFHQVVISAVFATLPFVLWFFRAQYQPVTVGTMLFAAASALAAVAVSLRLTFYFHAKVGHRGVLLRLRRQWSRVVVALDVLLSLLLLLAAILLFGASPVRAVLLLGAALANAVSFLVIEPATASAAFSDEDT